MINILIPLAGEGSRFKSTHTLPKPLIPVHNKPMIVRAIESLGIVGRYHFVVRNNEYMQQTMDAIYKVCYNPNIITISETTQGAASSALLLQNYMNGEEELIIANCDQIMNWNSYRVLSELRKHEGAVVTINDSDPKHSYVKMSGESAVQVTEKQVISNNALTGIHYWKHAKYFFESAKRMISENNKSANGEYYVAPTYNYLIKDGLDIGMCRIKNDEFYPVGTPEDLEKYLYDSR
jgi:NDP-sugar pyrophosphorylase family protein